MGEIRLLLMFSGYGKLSHGRMRWADRLATTAVALDHGSPSGSGTSSGGAGEAPLNTQVLLRLGRAGWAVSSHHVSVKDFRIR